MQPAPRPHDVCIVHNADANEWKDSIVHRMRKFASKTAAAQSPPSTNPPAVLDVVCLLDTELLDACRIPPSKIVVVLLSRGHLALLHRLDQPIDYRRLACGLNASDRLVLNCDLPSFVDLADEYGAVAVQFDDWTKLDSVVDERIAQSVGRLLASAHAQFDHENRLYMTSSDLVRSAEMESNDIRVVPTTLRCQEKNPVIVAFSKEVSVCCDDVEVVVSNSGIERTMPIKWINDRTLSFTAPDGRNHDEVQLTVRSGGASIGDATLTYIDDVTDDVMQIYVRQLDVLCSHVLRHSLMTPLLLDRMLADSIFTDDGLDDQISANAFEMLFSSVRQPAAGNICLQLPTLLHLGAKHGLKELCTKLIDLPDADRACLTTNVSGQRPADLAANIGHSELVAILDRQAVVCDNKPKPTSGQTEPEYFTITQLAEKPTTAEDDSSEIEQGHYLRMDNCAPNGRHSCQASNGRPSRPIDIEDDVLPDPPPFIHPPPRRKNSEPFVTPFHVARHRRPSLDVGPSSAYVPGSGQLTAPVLPISKRPVPPLPINEQCSAGRHASASAASAGKRTWPLPPLPLHERAPPELTRTSLPASPQISTAMSAASRFGPIPPFTIDEEQHSSSASGARVASATAAAAGSDAEAPSRLNGSTPDAQPPPPRAKPKPPPVLTKKRSVPPLPATSPGEHGQH